jgi:hypothetical protein
VENNPVTVAVNQLDCSLRWYVTTTLVKSLDLSVQQTTASINISVDKDSRTPEGIPSAAHISNCSGSPAPADHKSDPPPATQVILPVKNLPLAGINLVNLDASTATWFGPWLPICDKSQRSTTGSS